MRRLVLLTLLALVLAFAIATLHHPRVERVVISGNSRYSDAQIMALANVTLDDPFLWVSRWRARRLAQDPWIERARIVRHWPHSVSIHVWERRPALVMGEHLLALDGTVLGHGSGINQEDGRENGSENRELVRVEGWGESRLDEVLELLRLLEGFGPKMVSYSPAGFDVELAGGSLFTPDLEALKEHWAGFLGQQGKSVYIYPWGVSVGP
jgi:cell division protein FtsQ